MNNILVLNFILKIDWQEEKLNKKVVSTFAIDRQIILAELARLLTSLTAWLISTMRCLQPASVQGIISMN